MRLNFEWLFVIFAGVSGLLFCWTPISCSLSPKDHGFLKIEFGFEKAKNCGQMTRTTSTTRMIRGQPSRCTGGISLSISDTGWGRFSCQDQTNTGDASHQTTANHTLDCRTPSKTEKSIPGHHLKAWEPTKCKSFLPNMAPRWIHGATPSGWCWGYQDRCSASVLRIVGSVEEKEGKKHRQNRLPKLATGEPDVVGSNPLAVLRPADDG